MKKIYEGSTVEKCIEMACKEFGVSKENLTFQILEEKKSFFKRKVTVEIYISEETEETEEKSKIKEIDNSLESKDLEGEEAEGKNLDISDIDGTVKIINGKIIVKNPEDGGKPASILVTSGMKVIIDGVEFKGKKEVFEETNIQVSFDECSEGTASRELKIGLSEDYMEAYATIIYNPKKVYALKDKDESNMVTLQAELVPKEYPPKYNIEEVKKELANNKIVYGIIEENLKKCVEESCKKFLVAQGKQVKNGENDTLEIKFKTEADMKKLKEDKGGNIDFKSIGAVEETHKGDVIVVRHLGEEGEDGCNVTGKVTKCKPGKKIKLKAGSGCALSDENTVVAKIDGKPCIKNNTVYVYQVHEVKGDVDLKTGNIKFIGDVIVYGSVNEGMEVECGNSLSIMKDVERAKIRADGNIDIKGNVIASKIFGGGEDVKKIKAINDLKSFKETLASLIQVVEEMKKFNIHGKDIKDGEIIKLLIEGKFKHISGMCLSIITDIRILDDCIDTELGVDLHKLITQKLIGIAPISIKHYSELNLILSLTEEILVVLESTLALPVNLRISYCQDSNISSSGDIEVTGRGEYISELTANGSIYFVGNKGVARGGALKAKEEIKCKTVGSTAGVPTRLQVKKEGHIWVEVAYHNTIFAVGTREFVLDAPSRNIHAYLDSSGDIVVDRLKL